MGDLYNTQTRQPEDLPEDQIPSAILQGTHSYPANKAINVVGPDGKTGSLAGSDLTEALRQGYRLETSKEAAVNDYVEENKGLSGTAKVALGKFADEAGLGIPGLIYEKTQDPLEVAKWEALKKEHAGAKALGSVAGFGASLLYGGPLFEAAGVAGRGAEALAAKTLAAAGIERGSESMAKDLVAKTATWAAEKGAEGAAVVAPRAITEAALGDPEQAAETVLYGAGFGVVLGAALKPLEPAFGKLSQAFKKSQEEDTSLFKDFQNEKAADALGFNKTQRNKLRGGSEEAKRIGKDVLDATLSDGEKVFTPLSSTEDLSRKVTQFKEEAGQKIGDAYQKLDDLGVKTFNPLAVASRVDSELGTFWRSPLNRGETAQLENTLDSVLLRGEKNITFGEAQALKEELGQAAYPKGYAGGDVTPKMQLARDANRIVTEEIDKAVNAATSQIGDQGLLEQIQIARRAYSVGKNAERALEDKLKREGGNKFIGLTDTIAGIGIGSGVGALPAVAGVAGKKLIEKYGNQILATLPSKGILAIEQGMKRVAQKLDFIPQAIDSMSKITGGKNYLASVGILTRMVEGAKNRQDAFKKVASDISDHASNPMLLSDKITQASRPLQDGAPKISNEFSLKMANAVKYLDSQLPKPLSPPNPLIKQDFKPSDADISQFERKLHAVSDPFSIIDDLKNGSLTRDQVQAVATVYPKLYQQMQTRVVRHIAENEKTIPYQSRLKISLLMGSAFDASLSPQSIQGYQNSFASEEAAEKAKPKNTAKLGVSDRLSLKSNPTGV